MSVSAPKRRLLRWGSAATFAATLAVAAPRAGACDLCAIYTGSLMQAEKTGLVLGASEQYSDFGSIRTDGHEVSNPMNEWVHSSITQLLVGWSFTPRFGVQATIPLISREYRRLEDGTPTRGDASGLGDVSLLARYAPFSDSVGEALVHVELLAGLKLPTGDSGRLKEELDEEEAADAVAAAVVPPHHEGHVSAVHGHDLALGSGSVDGVFGAFVHGSWKRLFAEATVQYALRGNGDHGYEYANDLTWEAGAGVYLVAESDWTAALRFVTSGENKGRDHQGGVLSDDTALTAAYVGPGLDFTWKDDLSSEFALDLPVLQDNTGTQIVVDRRLRYALVWRF